MRYLKLSDIKIKNSFASSVPREEKMKECREFWNDNHMQDRYIVVDYNNVLVDGYIQYLVLKENNVEVAEIRVSDKKRKQYIRKNKEKSAQRSKRTNYKECDTTYIYGIHPNSKSIKERVWRVPNSWWQGWVNQLNIGDMMLVHTKHGLAPIKITKIKISDRCPVDIPIKTVVRKLKNEEDS